MRQTERARERTLQALAEGCADGRLSTQTHEERVVRALAARDAGELRQLTLDVERPSWMRRVVMAVSDVLAVGGPPRSSVPTLWLEGLGSRPLLIGRGGECDVIMRDASVSRRHAQIVRVDDGFQVADLGSLNGTWIGGRRVGQVEVAAGDVITLGGAHLRLV